MTVTLQSPGTPSAVLTALLGSLQPRISGVRIASAYVTVDGVNAVMKRVEAQIGSDWLSVPKQVVVSLDFGHTAPNALDLLADDHGFEVRVATSSDRLSGYRPTRSAFHPKIYLFEANAAWEGLVGSANFTRRAFTTNVEAVTDVSLGQAESDALWAEIWSAAIPWAGTTRDDYIAWRNGQTSSPAIDDTAVPAPTTTSSVKVLRSALAQGFDPKDFAYMWVQFMGTSGGSDNQLELPRGAYKFFAPTTAPTYGDLHENIADLTLRSPVRVWRNRPLTWHGNNKMERLNLPTVAQGGEPYANRVVLFKRLAALDMQITVEDRGTDVELAWRAASIAKGTLFGLGNNSPRQVGFF